MIEGAYVLDLSCDVVGCSRTLHVSEITIGPARNRAREEGWSVKISQDLCFCPDHKRSSKSRI